MPSQANPALCDMRALTMANMLERVTATLRQSPDATTYMVAADGMARALVVLCLGAKQLGALLPTEVIEAIPLLRQRAVGIKQERHLDDHYRQRG